MKPALNHGHGASLASQHEGRSVENLPKVGDHTSECRANLTPFHK